MRTNKLTSILISVILVLLAALVAVSLILFGQASKKAKLATEKNQTLQTELSDLRTRVTELETENETLKSDLSTAESALTEAEDTIVEQELEKEQAEQAVQDSVEAPTTVDVTAVEAGTVCTLDQVNFDNLSSHFVSSEIQVGDAVYNRIYGKSYVDNPNVPLSDLRYLKLLHYNFNHEVQVGELIVNVAIAEDICTIFQTLFEHEYEIEKMYLIDEYWTGEGNSSDTASVDANNTSGFCYRTVTGGGGLSNHAYGKAIDINPQQNPYVSYSTGSPVWYHDNANDYIDRDTGYDHVITHDDLCFQLFTQFGFEWGGDWSNPKDYQHFEKK